MTDLQSLHRALSEAESGSRELDAMIMFACFEWAKPEDPYYAPHCAGEEPVYWHAPEPYYKQECPHLSTSLDAITSLIERKLPPIKGFSDKPSEGWKFGVHRGLVPGLWSAWIRKHAEDGVSKMAPTPALALCIALVSALIAQESEK